MYNVISIKKLEINTEKLWQKGSFLSECHLPRISCQLIKWIGKTYNKNIEVSTSDLETEIGSVSSRAL